MCKVLYFFFLSRAFGFLFLKEASIVYVFARDTNRFACKLDKNISMNIRTFNNLTKVP